MKQNLINILVILSVLAIGVGLFLPPLASWQAHETLSGSGIAVFIVGAAVFIYGSVCGAVLAFENLKRHPRA